MQSLSHDDAFRILRRTGELINRLHGQPDLVVGIARSGTAFGDALAAASDARAFVVLGASRESSVGAAGAARSQAQRVLPGPVRRAYKSTVYPLAVRAAARRVDSRQLSAEERTALCSALEDQAGGPVVVVDDSIDTGKTITFVVRSIEEARPGTDVIIVALNSTIGARCGPHQLSLVHGAHLHNSDGDPSDLHRNGAPVRWRRAGTDQQPRPPVQRQLFLDLDHTLCRTNTFSMAAQILLRHAARRPTDHATRQLATAALLRKSRAVDHLHFKQAVDSAIRALSPDDSIRFQRELARRMRADARPALLSVATAPAVNAVIVTAALESYKPAIHEAFGLSVLTGAGPGSDGHWIEPDGQYKAAAIEAERDVELPGLLVGDAMSDLVAAGGVPTALIPPWDSSGLATILAATSWWQH